MTATVPEWVYRADLRPPETDLEPFPGPVTACSECAVTMGGPGTLEHLEDDYHAWTPARTLTLGVAGWVVAVLLSLPLAALAAAVLVWRYLTRG